MTTVKVNVDYATNVDDIKAKILSGTSSIVAQKEAVDRLTTSLGGNGLFVAANKATAAVDQLGGVTKLTASEQNKINTLLEKAIDKYTVMGMKAPPAMQALADATKGAGDAASKSGESVDNFGGLVERLTERFAIYEVLHAALDFTKEAFASAAAIEDLSSATGVSMEALQRFGYVGEESGIDMQTMARGVEQLSAKLAGGDKNAADAVSALGLNLKSLIASGPEQTFITTADAVGQIEDPMTRSAMAADLFGGRLGKQLLPMLAELREKLEAVPKDAIISDANIQKAKDFSVAIDHMKTRAEAWSVTFVGAMRDGITAWGDFLTNTRTLSDSERAAIDKATAAMLGHSDAAKTTLSNAQLLENHLTSLRQAGVEPLTAAQKTDIDVMKAGGDSLQTIARYLGVNIATVTQYEDAHTKATAAVNKHNAAVQSLVEQFSGVPEKVTELDAAVAKLGGVSMLSATELLRLSASAAALRDQGASLSPELATLAHAHDLVSLAQAHATATTKANAEATKLSGTEIGKQLLLIPTAIFQTTSYAGSVQLVSAAAANYQGNLAGARKVTTDWNTDLKQLAQTFDLLGSAIGNDVGKAITNIGHMSTAIVDAKKSFSDAKDASDKGDTLGEITDIASGIAGIASAAIDAGKAMVGLWNHFFGAAGRDAVSTFASSMGGFDAMHAQLQTLGKEGEQLWINLTQGVGRNNPAQAAAAVKAIQDALAHPPADSAAGAAAAGYQTIAQLQDIATQAEKTYEFMRDSGEYSASAVADAFTKAHDAQIAALGDEAAASIKAATTARDAVQQTVDALTSQITSLQNSINQEAPEEVMGSIEAAQRAQLAGLQQQKDAAQTKLDEMTAQLSDATDAAVAAAKSAASQAGTETVGAIQDALDNHTFNVKVSVSSSDDGSSAPGAATGGYVGKSNIIPFPTSYYDLGGSVFRPRGTDTVPAMLTPGEVVLNAAQQRNVAGAIGGDRNAELLAELRGLRQDLRATGTGGEGMTVVAQFGTERFSAIASQAARTAASTGRLKPRTARGRSY